jgi:hypothetical protein
MTIAICDMQFKNTKVQCVLWWNWIRWCWWRVFPIQTSMVSWLTTFKPIKTLFKLCVVVGIRINPQLIGSKCVTSTRFNLWTNTQNNKSNQKCENNTRPCAMNIRMPPHCRKRQTFIMQLSIVGGIPQGLWMSLGFKSWRTSLVFGIFMSNNGEVSWYMQFCPPSIPIFHPTLSSWHVYTTPLKMMLTDIYYIL